MLEIAILGFGKVGQTLLATIQNEEAYRRKFEVTGIWNRSIEKIQDHPLTAGINIFNSLREIEKEADHFDLIVECAHPNIMLESGIDILKKTDLFLSSPSVLSRPTFNADFVEILKETDANCYLPIGASVGIWDIIRLDKSQQLKSLMVTMTMHPDSYKIEDKTIRRKLKKSIEDNERIELLVDSIEIINRLAPQNTNTMTIYNIASGQSEGATRTGRLIADPSLKTHDITLYVETKNGLALNLNRINPARHGAVTGSATFTSFLQSLLHFDKGIAHNNFNFC